MGEFKSITADHLGGGVTPEQIAAARVTVADAATDADDCRALLDQLGIGEEASDG